MSRRSLLVACQAAFALVLLLCMFAPHNHVVVCTLASVTVEAETGGCECCRAKANAAPAPTRPDEDGIRAACPPHCCIDLVLDFDQGPLPERFAPALPRAEVVAMLPTRVEASATSDREWLRPHDTGPPRRDARAALVASTILRL